VWQGVVGSIENKAKSAQLELELGLGKVVRGCYILIRLGYMFLKWYVVFVSCNAAHNFSMWTYFYFLFLCHMSSSGFEAICKVQGVAKKTGAEQCQGRLVRLGMPGELNSQV
jgi:hypothetical protein